MDRFAWPAHTLVLFQLGIAATGLGAVRLLPPRTGTMLLVPIDRSAAARMLPRAVAAGARLIGPGPWRGSLVVSGERGRLAGPLLHDGILTLAAAAAGCDPARQAARR